jgi:TonB family protein
MLFKHGLFIAAFALSAFIGLGGCSSAPTQDQPARVVTLTPYQTYIKNLNDRVDPFWKQELKTALDSSQGLKTSIQGQKKTSCLLEIKIDKDGKVLKTKLIKGSGKKAIDKASLTAIQKASPLPAPPRAWVKGKAATIRWEFVLKDQ